MADNLAVTPGSGATMAADEATDGTLGSVKIPFAKIMDGTLDSTNKLVVTSGGAALVDGSATTQPVSAASLPLPTGAATAAKQPALGTAGTPSADVITVQGKTSMTPLLVDPSGVTSPVSLASVPSHAVTNAGTFAVQADNTKVAGTAVDVNSGNKSAGTQRIVIATDQPAFSTAGLISVKTDQTTHGTTDLVAADITKVGGTTVDTNSGNKSAGTQRIVLATDQPNLTTSLNTFLKPDATDNSLSSFSLVAAATTNATSVKASAGKLYYLSLSNSDTVGYWFKLYNKASAPTVGTDVPVSTRYIPPGGGREVPMDLGGYYSTGIAYAITLNATDADTTAVTNANKVTVHGRYI